MHNFDVKYQNFVYAIMTNKELSDDERSKIIAEFMNDFNDKYPDLGDTATKKDLNETELRLIKEIKEIEINGQKEIEKIRLDMKEIESNAQKEREEIRLTLTKEIDKTNIKIETIKSDTLKWMFVMMVGQIFAISGIIVAIFKFFK